MSGQAAKDWDRFNVDWVPTLCLGHSKQQLKDPEGAAARSQRAAERRKRCAETVEKEMEEKLQNIDEPGETIQEIISNEEALMGGDLNQDRETGAEQANCASINLEQTLVDAETQTVNPERKVETQTVATQTDEFEYLFKETVVQPFTEEYFVNNEDRVQFYTGLHGFDVLKATFDFVSPFVTRRSKTFISRIYHGFNETEAECSSSRPCLQI